MSVQWLSLFITTASAASVSRSLFGQDLEFTRHDLWEGLSAEMIANRKFAAPSLPISQWPQPIQQLTSAGVAGRLPRWSPIGSPTLDTPYWSKHSTLLTGEVGHSVHCATQSAGSCGVEQGSFLGGFDAGRSFGSSIVLEHGRAYSLRLVLKGTGAHITAQLSSTTGGALLWSQSFATAGDEWITFNTSVLASREGGTTTCTLRITGAPSSSSWWLGSASLTPAGDNSSWKGMRVDTVDALDALGFRGLLRWPGGCFAPFYRWKGLLPPDLRPPIETPASYCTAVRGGVNAYSDGMMENGVGVDDYMALVKRLRMVPSVTLRLQYGTEEEVQEAADLVEYLNGDAMTTKWGRLRATRRGGDPTPYNVSHFYLGNEIAQQARYAGYPDNQKGDPACSATEYARLLAAVVPALLAVDAAEGTTPLRFLVVSIPGDAWNTAWASKVGGQIDAVSFHDGYFNQPEASNWTPEAVNKCVQAPSRQFIPDLQALRKTLDTVANGSAASVGVSADEWGLGPPWLTTQFSVAHGMYAAAFLGSCAKAAQGTQLLYTNYFEPVNEGAITVRATVGIGGSVLTPVGRVMQFYSRHADGEIVTNLVTNFSSVGLDLLATTHGGQLLVTLAGLDAVGWAPLPLRLTLPPTLRIVQKNGATRTVARIMTLPANGYGPNSTFGAIVNHTAKVSPSGEIDVTVPPLSVVQLSISYNYNLEEDASH